MIGEPLMKDMIVDEVSGAVAGFVGSLDLKDLEVVASNNIDITDFTAQELQRRYGMEMFMAMRLARFYVSKLSVDDVDQVLAQVIARLPFEYGAVVGGHSDWAKSLLTGILQRLGEGKVASL